MLKKFLLLTASVLVIVGCKETVKESGEGASLDVDVTAVSFPATGGMTAVNVTSNCYWDVSVEDSEGHSVSWVTASPTKGQGNSSLTIDVKSNVKTEPRMAFLTVSTPSGQNLSKVVSISQDPGEEPAVEGYPFPVCQTIDIDSPESRQLINAVIGDNVCMFNDGMVVTWGNPDGKLSLYCPSHTQPSTGDDAARSIHRSIYFDGFAPADSFFISIPVKERLAGDLRLMLGARNASFTVADNWAYYWGTDGVTWNKIDIKNAVTPGSDAVWNVIPFTIPENLAVPAGGTLMFKFNAVGWKKDKLYISISNSICVDYANAEASDLPPMDVDRVAYSNGFDDLTGSLAADVFLPTGWLRSATSGYASNYTSFGDQYVLPDEYQGISAAKGCYERPGYIQVGYYDESLWTRQAIGKFTVKLGERLKLMGVSSADAKISFMAYRTRDFRGYDPLAAITASFITDGDTTVVRMDVPVDRKSECSYEIQNVNLSTLIEISCPGLSDDEIAALDRGEYSKYLLDYRFYLDDVLVELTEVHSRGTSSDGGNEDFNEGDYNW